MSYRIFMEPNGRSCGRSYLVMKYAQFRWLDTLDFDTWDECEAKASTFTEFETAMLLIHLRAQDTAREYNIDIQGI